VSECSFTNSESARPRRLTTIATVKSGRQDTLDGLPANPIPSGTGALASLTTPPAPQRKSEAIAFLLSFFSHGAGAYYCGKKRAGLWTFGLTVLSVLILYLLARPMPQGTLLLVTGPLFRVSLFLCAFAVWDALATARAVNAGRGNVDRFNPRLAAVLNLATRGFGYFYLRERRLGLAAFLYPCLFAMAATHWNSILFTLLLEGSTIYFAVHSYWLARKKNPAVPRSRAIHARTANAWDCAAYGYTVLLAMMCVISLAVGSDSKLKISTSIKARPSTKLPTAPPPMSIPAKV
jgi:hypothetical protein